MRRTSLLAALALLLTGPAHADFIGRTMSATCSFADAATPYPFASFAPGTIVVGAGQETVGDAAGSIGSVRPRRAARRGGGLSGERAR